MLHLSLQQQQQPNLIHSDESVDFLHRHKSCSIDPYKKNLC